MNSIYKGFCYLLAVLMLTGAVGCGSNVETSSGGKKTSDKDNGGYVRSDVNPITSVAKKPTKPWVEPTSVSEHGAAAPEWLRDAEMCEEASMGELFGTEKALDEMTPYFDLCLGTWSNDVENFKMRGLKAGSYFDPYHVFDKTEYAVMDDEGDYVCSDYMSESSNSLYLICHNSQDSLDYCLSYAQNCLDFGAQGMFYDDIRMPYGSLSAMSQKCYSTKHKHDFTGDNSTNYAKSTLPALYKLVKQTNPQYYVILNGAIPYMDDSVFKVDNMWKISDALMWENFLYDSNAKRWMTSGNLIKTLDYFKKGFADGKVEVALTYFQKSMSKEQLLRAARETIAYCRLYDMIWTDYGTLPQTSVGKSEAKKYYAFKTGPAAQMGTYYGVVTDDKSGEPISGAKLSAGNVSVTTDANGHFRITMPVNQYSVKLSHNGYEDTTGKVCGYKCNLKMHRKSGKVYYVASYGNNDNDGSSPEKPVRSINFFEAKGLLKPGDTVVVKSGTYNVPNETVYTTDGTAESPITYVADGDVTVRIKNGDGTAFRICGDYNRFVGFCFEGSKSGIGGIFDCIGNGIEISGCTFRDTAFFNDENIKTAEYAVKISGDGVLFHNNVAAGNIYAKAVLLVEGNKAVIVNNTFDGLLTGGKKTETAIGFAEKTKDISVKNNIFVDFSNAYSGYSAKTVTADKNLFAGNKDFSGKGKTSTDRYVKDVRFMNRPFGDYTLKIDSAAVNKGADVGFAFRGEAPDIGACESKYSEKGYNITETSNNCRYRIFADSIVIANGSKTGYKVTVPTGRPGVKLRDISTGKTYKADASGKVTVFVECEDAALLKAE